MIDVLRPHQPNALVGLKCVSDLKGVADAGQSGLTILDNLRIPAGQSPTSPVFFLRVNDDNSPSVSTE
jgi:hypothetical protein